MNGLVRHGHIGKVPYRIIRSFSDIYSTKDSIEPELNEDDKNKVLQIETISKSMRNYFRKANLIEKSMKIQRNEFEIGKRHLANIMGLDALTLTQKGINDALAYLLPSGLFSHKARPQMKPPDEIFHTNKELRFDHMGRPLDTFFYTRKPKYNRLIYNMVEQMEKIEKLLQNKLDEFELSKGKKTFIPNKFNMTGYRMLTIEELSKKCNEEKINYIEYKHFQSVLERILSNDISNEICEFLQEFIVKMDMTNIVLDIPPILKDEKTGLLYTQAYGKRKTGWSFAKLYQLDSVNSPEKLNLYMTKPQVTININRDLSYFPNLSQRSQIILPLTFWGSEQPDILCRYAIDLRVQNRGPIWQMNPGLTTQAGAARLAVARALSGFLSPVQIEKMRLAGLLSYDVRTRERKKPGQKGARAKFKWRKR